MPIIFVNCITFVITKRKSIINLLKIVIMKNVLLQSFLDRVNQDFILISAKFIKVSEKDNSNISIYYLIEVRPNCVSHYYVVPSHVVSVGGSLLDYEVSESIYCSFLSNSFDC